MRRGRIGRVRGAISGGISALTAAMALATVWFDGDDYLLDGTGTVLAIYDRKDPARLRVVTQPDTAKQVQPPAPHADYPTGARCYTLTGAQWYPSNQAGAFWNWLSSGASMSANTVCTPTAVNTRLCSTRNAGNGFLLGIQAGPSWLAYVQGGPGPGFGRALNVPSMWGLRFTDGGGSPEYTAKVTGFSALTGDSTTPTPSGLSLMLGANPDTSLPFVGRVAVLNFGTDYGAAGMAVMQNALTALTGIAA